MIIHWFLNARKFVPKAHYDTVYDIDYDTLYNQGKRLILMDLDNTLIPYDKFTPEKHHIDLMNKIRSIGFEIVLISNNRKHRVKTFADPINLAFHSNAKKPLKGGFKKALNLTEQHYPFDEIIVVGDQLMTDVYGANRAGYDAILVTPIKKSSEKWYTKLNRLIENKMLEKIKRCYPITYKKLEMEKRIHGK